ncbi:hypothetical protein SAMN04488071_0841 [Kordiimonas lacus]|uniref:RiboL-PSP-HEPN domain-containing protein n=2 Tax=Kordiimonas lacus TaxID=637679 RepID=A0A1G6VSU0_9PROT|nr:hypothetical protein SAMN04488071_0841 [Kordiimonas lacus]
MPLALEQEYLAEFHNLFRTGYLAWGHNLSNASRPFFHITAIGKRAIEIGRRDPSNPIGYMAHLNSIASLPEISTSYLDEALHCFVSAQHKAAAVMLGAASEAIAIDLRDAVVATFGPEDNLPNNLNNWLISKVLNGLKTFFDGKKSEFPRETKEKYEAYWAAFTHQLRTTRNDVGHPTSLNPVSEEAVHASFLIFPEIAQLANHLKKSIES